MSTATVTGKQGIANTVTAQQFANVQKILYDSGKKLLKVTDQTGQENDYDVSAATTVTVTISSGNMTYTIS